MGCYSVGGYAAEVGGFSPLIYRAHQKPSAPLSGWCGALAMVTAYERRNCVGSGLGSDPVPGALMMRGLHITLSSCVGACAFSVSSLDEDSDSDLASLIHRSGDEVATDKDAVGEHRRSGDCAIAAGAGAAVGGGRADKPGVGVGAGACGGTAIGAAHR